MKMLMRGAHLHIFLCWNVINYYVLWWWMQLSMAGPPCLISYQKILRSKKWIGIPNFTFHFTPLSLCLQISLHHCRWQTFPPSFHGKFYSLSSFSVTISLVLHFLGHRRQRSLSLIVRDLNISWWRACHTGQSRTSGLLIKKIPQVPLDTVRFGLGQPKTPQCIGLSHNFSSLSPVCPCTFTL